MIERVIRKQDQLSGEELEALDACTLCRACESVCPSKMAFADLYLQAWQAIGERPKRSLAMKLVFGLVEAGSARLSLMDKLIRFYQRSGMQGLLRKLPGSPLKAGLKELEQLIPVPHAAQAVADFTEAKTPLKQGSVGLFTGCMGNLFDSQTHNATISLLTRLGYEVQVLENQACCGATYAHNGELEQARACARQNLAAFSEGGLEAVIYNSSGCGAFLSEYPQLLDQDESEAMQQAMPLATDILDFLSTRDWPDELALRALKAKVAVHEPCSQRNVLESAPVIYELLGRIPGLEIVPLPGNEMCCGAGGTKMVTQPELANPPRDEKVAALLDTEADLLISTNLSCALHLASGIRQSDADIQVMHPVALLSQQLK
jgi:glycolate oxidase iron-sulfur subunit